MSTPDQPEVTTEANDEGAEAPAEHQEALESSSSWWGRRRKRAKVGLVVGGVVVLALVAGGLTVLVSDLLRPSDAELVQTLATTTDTNDRQKVALDLAARRSVEVTRELATMAEADETAGLGLAALRDGYIQELAALQEEYAADVAAEKDDEALKKKEDALAETVDCLAAIGDASSVEALGVFSCSGEADLVDVRVHAVQAMIGTDSALALTRLLEAAVLRGYPGGNIAQAAQAGLRQMPVSALVQARVENSENQPVSGVIEQALAGAGESAARELVTGLSSLDLWADEVLSNIGAEAVPLLAEKLTSSESSVRCRALGVLLVMHERGTGAVESTLVLPEMVPLLMEAREAGYGDQRDATAEAVLANIGEPAVQPLVAHFIEATWTDGVLVEIGPAAVSAVSQELTNGEKTVRYRALGVLLSLYGRGETAATAELTQPGMVPLLIEARTAGLGDERDAEILGALAETGDPAVVPLLQAALVEGSGVVLDDVASVVVSSGGASYPAVCAVLADEGQSAAVRSLAAELVGRSCTDYGGTDSPYGPLVNALAAEATVAETAQHVLASLSDAESSLIYAAQNRTDAGRWGACAALLEMNCDSSDADELRALFENRNLKGVAARYEDLIQVGQTGTEGILVDALLKYGSISMAEGYLNCGSPELEAGAREWVRRRSGLYIKEGGGTGGGPTWGW